MRLVSQTMLQTTQLPYSVSVHSSSSSFCYAQHGACTLKEVAALDFEAIAIADSMQSCRADDLSQARAWMISAHLRSSWHITGRQTSLSSLTTINFLLDMHAGPKRHRLGA